VIEESSGKFLKDVHLFDVFESEKLGAGKKSVAYTLTFSNPEATLTDEEIDAAMKKVEKKLTEKFAVEVR
jgi:phenylalanyl-tRNA synthetase beta chain